MAETVYGEAVECSTCGKRHAFDLVVGYECLVLVDGRDRPNLVVGAWCDEGCFSKWLNSPQARALFPTM